MGSDRCHTVTHNVPIQAQHPPSWPRKVTRTTKETLLPRRTARLPAPGGPGIILDDQICLHVVTMGVAWTVEVTGYPHLPGTQARQKWSGSIYRALKLAFLASGTMPTT